MCAANVCLTYSLAEEQHASMEMHMQSVKISK